MARNRGIRITKRDREEYNKLARNVRGKINRVQKQYGIDLTGEISVPKLEHFQTREGFNKWKEESRSFTNRANLNYQFVKNEQGFAVSKKELATVQRNIRRAQQHHDKQIADLEKKPYIAGGRIQQTMKQQLGQMGRPQVDGRGRLHDLDFSDIQDRQHFERRAENAQMKSDPNYYRESAETMKNNWIDLARKNFGADGEELISKVEEMSGEDFYNMYLTHEEFAFTYMYPDEDIVLDFTMEDLKDTLEMYVERRLDLIEEYDLNGF